MKFPPQPSLQGVLFSALICLLFWSQTVSAEVLVNHLYQARVALPDRSTAAQQAAIRQGLAQVLVKVSGYSGTPGFTGVADELARADRYLLEFSIESQPQVAADGLATQPGEALWMRFNQEQVDALVRRWEIPVWPSSRPEIALRLQAPLAGQWISLKASQYPAAAALLAQQAFARGISISLLDPASAPPPDNPDYLGELWLALDRFGQQQVSLTVVRPGGAAMQAEAGANGLAGAMQAALDQLVDRLSLAQSFVAGGAPGGQIILELRGITTLTAYQRALESLRSLEMVDRVQVLQLDTQQVQVRVSLAANLGLLLDALIHQGVLLPAESGLAPPGPGEPLLLNYRER